jgi:superfamily II DNA/RNA helicase
MEVRFKSIKQFIQKTSFSLDHLYETPKTLVFVEQKRQSDRIGIVLNQNNFKALSLNAYELILEILQHLKFNYN